MDKSTITGIILAIGGIVGGTLLEGGRIGQLVQPTAAMIVVGGTLGAVLIAFPLPIVIVAFTRSLRVVFRSAPDYRGTLAHIVSMADRARRDGILSLDAELGNITDPFLRRALMMAVDGVSPIELRKIVEIDLDLQLERDEEVPRVFESAGGFSPTVGIIGAVLGLIQVMQHLDNIAEVGKGIAVAFVATIYGVALANLLFLPAAAKLKTHAREEHLLREMMLEGVCSILEGLHPRMVQLKLEGFLGDSASPAEPEKELPQVVEGSEI
jgi:chemotaxis protein MotA